MKASTTANMPHDVEARYTQSCLLLEQILVQLKGCPVYADIPKHEYCFEMGMAMVRFGALAIAAVINVQADTAIEAANLCLKDLESRQPAAKYSEN